MKFRKKPVVIDAIQYTGNNGYELYQWSGGKIIDSPVLEPSDINPTGAYVQIKTLEGTMIGIVGDWIICGWKFEYYPCKNDVFEATYEPYIAEEKKQICDRPSVHNCPIDVDGLCMSFHPCVYKKHED